MPIVRAMIAALKSSKKAMMIADMILSAFAICLIFIISLLASLAQPVEVPRFLNLPRGSAKAIIAHLDNQNFNMAKFDHFVLRFLGQAQSGFVELGGRGAARGGGFGVAQGAGGAGGAGDGANSNLSGAGGEFSNAGSAGNSSNSNLGANIATHAANGANPAATNANAAPANGANPAPAHSVTMTRLDFLFALTRAKAATINLTLIPGETSEIFLRQVAGALGLDLATLRAEFFALAPAFNDGLAEGALVPETYNVARGFSAGELAEFLLAQSKTARERLKAEFDLDERDTLSPAENLRRRQTWKSALIAASIIQKEAADPSEFALVSGVIQNRLRIKMPLQMDGTLNYGNHSHERITPQRIASDTSAFNTYKFAGLPPSPVCNPSLAAVRAALQPRETAYLYFVRDIATGKHIFSTTFQEHRRNIEKSNRAKRQGANSNLKDIK